MSLKKTPAEINQRALIFWTKFLHLWFFRTGFYVL